MLWFFCTDVNECETENPCVQTCVNTYGSFICRCDPGYELEEDGIHCSGNGLGFDAVHLLRDLGLGQGFVAGVSSHFLVVCLVGDIPQYPGNTTHRTEMSHILRDGVQAYLPGHLTFNAKSAEIPSVSEMKLVRGRTHPVLPVGLRVICLFPTLTQDLKMV